MISFYRTQGGTRSSDIELSWLTLTKYLEIQSVLKLRLHNYRTLITVSGIGRQSLKSNPVGVDRYLTDPAMTLHPVAYFEFSTCLHNTSFIILMMTDPGTRTQHKTCQKAEEHAHFACEWSPQTPSSRREKAGSGDNLLKLSFVWSHMVVLSTIC